MANLKIPMEGKIEIELSEEAKDILLRFISVVESMQLPKIECNLDLDTQKKLLDELDEPLSDTIDEATEDAAVYDKIESILAQKNMSRRQLAKAIDVPPTTLQSAFEKKSNISVGRLKKICAFLNVRIDEVL